MAQTKVTKYFSARKVATFGESRSQKRKISNCDSLHDNTAEYIVQTTKKRRTTHSRRSDLRKDGPNHSGIIHTNEQDPPCTQKETGMVTQNELKIKQHVDISKWKTRLSKCAKLHDLKVQLASMNKNLHELKRGTHSSHSLSLVQGGPEAQVTGVTKVTEKDLAKDVSTKYSTTEFVPAYEKYHSLALPGIPTLGLPYKYKQLLEIFTSVDTIVRMLHSRREICTFSKLQTAVQRMLNRNFEPQHLGQLRTVYPTAYVLRQERNVTGEKSGYHLTIEANLQEDTQVGCNDTGYPFFSLALVTWRKATFHKNLITEVHHHHKTFLSSLTPPMSVADDEIKRWHPKFRLDHVPDIAVSPLPEPPVVKTFTTAKDVLQYSQVKLIPRVEAALRVVATPNSAQPTPEPTPTNPQSVTTATPCLNAILKGVPASLLDKIRAREAAKVGRSMVHDSDERRMGVLKRLPDTMHRLRGIFVTEKKLALPKSWVIQKLAESAIPALSRADANDHIQMLLEVVPRWLRLVVIRKGEFLKMDHSLQLTDLHNKIDALTRVSLKAA